MVLLGPTWLPSDAVHGVLWEEAWDAGREAQAFERSATEGKAEIQTGVLVLYALQPVWVVVPVDMESGHSGIRSQDVSLKLREVWLCGWVLPKLWVWVLIVDIVAHTNELLSMVGAGDKNHSHTHSVRLRNEGWVGGISLKDEHMSSSRDRTHQH